MSAAGQAHVVPDVAVANERRSAPSAAPAAASERSPALPLLFLVIALAAAAVWFVALPQLARPAKVERSCEVIVLESGSTKCVRNPKAGSKAGPQKTKLAGRAKQ